MCISCQIYLYFHPRNAGPSYLKGACGCVNTNIYKSAWAIFLNYFSKNNVLKNPTIILLGRGGGVGEGGCPVDPNPHFLGSGPRETGKLNQTDGDKGLPKCGIYIGVTPCKKLGNMKKQQKHTDWVL